MKSIFIALFLINLVSTLSFAQEIDFGQMNYDKSVLVKATPHFPLGESFGVRIATYLKDLGTKNIVISAPGRLFDESGNRVDFGSRVRPGTNLGVSSFIAQSHLLGLTTTIKLELVDFNLKELNRLAPKNPTEFLDSYAMYAINYAKLAQKSGAEELALTGLAKFYCEPKSSYQIKSIVERIKSGFKGRLRLDFFSPNDYIQNFKCLSENQNQFHGFGVDWTESDISNMDDFASNGVIISKMQFTGSLENAKSTAQSVFRLMSRYRNKSGITISSYYTDPFAAGLEDLSDSPRSKPVEDEIQKWLQN